MIAAVEEMCSEKTKLFKTVSLWERKLLEELRTLGSMSILINKACGFEWFSWTLAKLTNITNTAQLSSWGSNVAFEVTEKLASMNSLYRRAAGENIFKSIKNMSSVQPQVESAKMVYVWW